MRPSDWNEEDKLCAREQARLGAITALEELYAKFNSLLISKILNMVMGWALIQGSQWLLTHYSILQGH